MLALKGGCMALIYKLSLGVAMLHYDADLPSAGVACRLIGCLKRPSRIGRWYLTQSCGDTSHDNVKRVERLLSPNVSVA